MGTFDWIDLPEGKARFSGTKRGWDELGHKTFALDIDGREYYGELERAYLPNENDYNVEVSSFGYARAEDVGMPDPRARAAFSEAQIGRIQSLALGLIAAGCAMPDPPAILDQTGTARFMGEVTFKQDWALAISGMSA